MHVRIHEAILIAHMFKKENLLLVLLCGLIGSIKLSASTTEIKANERNFQSIPENIGMPAEDLKQPSEKLAWPSETGIATRYAAEMSGHFTASGEPYDPEQLTAAHKTIPIGSLVRVTHLKSDQHVTVRINDRWSGRGDRIINLSQQAAIQLNFGSAGTAPVHLEVESLAQNQDPVTVSRIQSLPMRLENTSTAHSKAEVCQNEAEILGLTGNLLHNHIKLCLARVRP